MYVVARTTQQAVHKEQRPSDSAMARRMTLIVATDAACWMPIILLGVLSLGGITVPPQVNTKFYISLTVHLVMMLGKWPTWRTFLFYVFISIFYLFQATSCSSSGESIVSIQYLVYVTLCQWPFHVQVRKFLSNLHTKWLPTQSDMYQIFYWYNWFSWWWARGCSKHVENWNKYIEKNCVPCWSFTKNHK